MHLPTLHLTTLSTLCALLTGIVQAAPQSCHVASSQLYIDALYAKTPKAAAAIPLEPDVKRYESFAPSPPLLTAVNAPTLRLSIYAGASTLGLVGPGPTSISLTDVNATTTLADYTSQAGLGVPAGGGVRIVDVRIVEYFTFVSAGACGIKRIDAVFSML